MDNIMEKIVSLCKRRGFIFPASEIYGGFANAFDFGPLGVQMKKNIKDLWWQKFVTMRDDIVGLDSAIIQNPKVWEASGHLKSFSDPLVECKKCNKRLRKDHYDELKESTDGFAHEQITLTPEQKEIIICSKGGEHEFTEAKDFNLMFKTFVGVVEDSASTTYLRPETAQGIFADFQNVLQSTRVKLPFGIAQIGKAFRNEITPGNFIFRTREFEQAEVEYFIKPDKENSEKVYRDWISEVKKFYLDLGIKAENLKEREHDKDELSHYSAGTTDIEYNFPFGFSELAGIAQRTDYDLKQHQDFSKQNLEYFDEVANERFLPYVVEPSMGVDRAMLAFLTDAYSESDGSDGREKNEVVLKLNPKIAPIQVACFPLMKKDKLPEIANHLRVELAKAGIRSYYDESGSIGRRYRRQDEIGTPWCVTADYDSLKDDSVTIRDRDTLKQERIKISEVEKYILERLK